MGLCENLLWINCWSIICQKFLFGYFPNVDLSLNGHLQSATHYGTYLYPYICRGMSQMFYDVPHCCSQAWLRCQSWFAHWLHSRQRKMKSIFHLTMDVTGWCPSSEWLLMNSFRYVRAETDMKQLRDYWHATGHYAFIRTAQFAHLVHT